MFVVQFVTCTILLRTSAPKLVGRRFALGEASGNGGPIHALRRAYKCWLSHFLTLIARVGSVAQLQTKPTNRDQQPPLRCHIIMDSAVQLCQLILLVLFCLMPSALQHEVTGVQEFRSRSLSLRALRSQRRSPQSCCISVVDECRDLLK